MTERPSNGGPSSRPVPQQARDADSLSFEIERAIASDLLDPGVAEQVQKRIDGWISRLNAIEVTIQRGNLSTEQLITLESRVFDVADEAERFQKSAGPILVSVERRLTGLGDPAADGRSELESLTQQRESLVAVQTILGSFKSQIGVVRLQALDLSGRIAKQRRQVFVDRLLVRADSLFSGALWTSALADVPRLEASFVLLFRDWFSLIEQKIGSGPAIAVFSVFLATVILVWPLRRRLLRYANRPASVAEPTPMRRSSAALAMVLLATAVPALVWIALYSLISFLDVAPTRIVSAIRVIFGTATFVAFGLGLATAMLAPTLPGWRLLPLTDRTAQRLYAHIVITMFAYGVAIVIAGFSSVLFADEATRLIIRGVVGIGVSLAFIRAMRILSGDRGEDDGTPDDVRSGLLAIWSWLAPVFWLAAVASIGAILLGYVWLGWFVAVQMVWVVLIFTVSHLLLQFVDDVLSEYFRYGTPVARSLRNALGFKSQTTEQIGVVLSGILRMLITVFAIISLVVPWGFTSGDLVDIFRPILSELTFGSLRFSFAGVFGALLVFAIVFSLTRVAKRWLENKFLPKTRLDIGLKSSISTGFGYVGFIVAALLALAYAGLNLQNIAIVAGALSVGIGLGLQSIVNNFVSGLIMLAERPIKVGDWVVVGAEQGYVRRINVRATEIETFERSTVIVPNSNLISGVVKNWMHGSSLGRVIIPVRVSYDTDPEVVRDLLHAAAKAHSKVTSYPPPDVFFMAFGESSLNFELRVYLPDINDFLMVASDLHFDVFRRLKAAGIVIPFPQQDIHLRSGGDVPKLSLVAPDGREMPTDTPTR